MRSDRRTLDFLRGGAISLVALGPISCGSAAPNELLVPYHASSEGTDAGPSTGANDAAASENEAEPEFDATIVDAADSSQVADVSTCGPQTCDGGCCDMTGTCVEGTDESACGVGGSACSMCASDETCNAGTCSSNDASDEGGGCVASSCKCALSTPCCTLAGACGCRLGLACL
jgi:hypothetical protein